MNSCVFLSGRCASGARWVEPAAAHRMDWIVTAHSATIQPVQQFSATINQCIITTSVIEQPPVQQFSATLNHSNNANDAHYTMVGSTSFKGILGFL